MPDPESGAQANKDKAFPPHFADTLPKDADLRSVADAWPDLPAPIKAGIVAMVRATLGR
ncbi:MAG: hypothetical protein ACLQVA_00175 [Candidatus Brocadiia bacterium]